MTTKAKLGLLLEDLEQRVEETEEVLNSAVADMNLRLASLHAEIDDLKKRLDTSAKP